MNGYEIGCRWKGEGRKIFLLDTKKKSNSKRKKFNKIRNDEDEKKEEGKIKK